MIIITSPVLVLLGGLFFFVFVVPYWWLHYAPEGQTFRQWIPSLLIVAAVIAFFAFVVGR